LRDLDELREEKSDKTPDVEDFYERKGWGSHDKEHK